MPQPPKILIAPLDWGLGHATRCIPIIREFQAQGAEVMLGVAGRAGALLKQEFPELTCLEVPAYDPVYPENSDMVTAMGKQFFRFLKIIRRERKEVARLVKEHNIDLIISDSRFGFHADKVPSIIITHQIFLLMPWHFKIAEPGVNVFNRTLLNNFNDIWIPDNKTHNRIAGQLSHRRNLPQKYSFIGPLSRFTHRGAEPVPGKVVILLSGPEPQRSLLEHKLLQQINGLPYSFTMLRGTTEAPGPSETPYECRMIGHLPAQEMQELLESAEMVICRSGYSSIMDLVALHKKALLIPTPGQTEQEYLADYLKDRNWFISRAQDEVNLRSDLQALKKQTPGEWPGVELSYKDTVKRVTELLT